MSQKNVPPLACYNFNSRERFWYFWKKYYQ